MSSERFIVEQVNKSRDGSGSIQLHHDGTPLEAVAGHPGKSPEAPGSDVAANGQRALVVPHEDDIEKSFRVNEDGSMTVEMKVHLTIKEAEVLHWTTTLSRSSLSRRTVYTSLTGSANSSPDSNNAVAKHSFVCEEETKEENCPAQPGRAVAFKKHTYEGYTSATEKAKSLSRRIPTPGPRHVKKMASVESVTTVTSSGVQEHTLGHYSYMERIADGGAEGYCLVRHSSSGSNRPVPKPRKTASAGLNKDGSLSKRPTGVAEVLKIENNGMEVRETVMHIYEHQGCIDNYYANEGFGSEYAPMHASASAGASKPSTVSSSNDCDIDISPAESRLRQGEEMLSLSSEPVDREHRTRTAASSRKRRRRPKSGKKNVVKPSGTQKGSTSSSDRKMKAAAALPSVKKKNPFTAKHRGDQKKVTSSESAKSGTKSNSAEKSPVKPVTKGAKLAQKVEDILTTREHVTGSPAQGQNKSKGGAKTTGHNVNTPSLRPQIKKNISGILMPRKALQPGKKTSQPKSVVRTASPKKPSGLSEGFSRPSPLPPPCEVHQYVENWLEKISPDGEPYPEEAFADESEAQARVEFQLGGDSEENEKNEDDDHEFCQSASQQHVADLCAEHQEKRSQTRRLAEAILVGDRDAASSPSKEKIKPIMQHICSAVQSIKRASDTDTPPRPDKANKFSMQVASVFGSSCKLFLSFLSVMILQDYITGGQSRSASEATLMMESLQRVSANKDEEEQRMSLEELQNKASFQLKKSWKDFKDLSDRTEAETDLTLNVKGEDVSEGQFLIIDELMVEMNISQDLRELISSAIRLASSFCPVEESGALETEWNQLDQAKESEVGDEVGWGEGIGDKIVTNVQEEWKTENDKKIEEELNEKMSVGVQDELDRVEAGEMEVSEEELKDGEAGEDEINDHSDEWEGCEGTEEEREAHSADVGERPEGEERLMERTEKGEEKDEMQSEGEDVNSGGEGSVAITGKDVAEEAGEECVGNIRSASTPEEEQEQSEQSTEQDSRHDEIDEESSVPHGAVEDLDLNKKERATVDSDFEQNAAESPFKYSSEDQCEDDKGNGMDTVTEDGEEHCEERSNNLPHPLEISQELLDFVNSALQSSSLIFTYDSQGNVRLEPDISRVLNTGQTLASKRRKDSQYGLKILPSPSTSELSDYRPETSESWGSKPQESIDIATDSGEDSSDHTLIGKHETKISPQEPDAEPVPTGSSAKSFQDSQEQSRGSISSFSSGTEPLKKDSSKPATEVTQCSSVSLAEDSTDGVLIDQGRWLLKENHLIRKSPPVTSGMYGNTDSTSTDSSQENDEDTVTQSQSQLNPLTYISSSEIEELTKPKTPKCTYYNMPHGSDSDPFLDDCSLKSEKHAASGGKRRAFRVSPAIDTSKSWASKNGSLSSFTSVEFKMPDGKIHPEGESSARGQTRRTSSGGRRALQAQDSQDSQDTLNVRCSQYCPIL